MKKIAKWRGQLGLDKYNTFVSQFHKETDRAAGILAGSFVECSLRDFLLAFLINDAAVCELFDGPYAPLSTFSARAKLCFAMGLISKGFLRNLDIVREIRNHFAHHPLATSFANPEVEHLCFELSLAKILHEVENKTGRKFGPRDVYLVTIGSIVVQLNNAKFDHKQCKAGD